MEPIAFSIEKPQGIGNDLRDWCLTKPTGAMAGVQVGLNELASLAVAPTFREAVNFGAPAIEYSPRQRVEQAEGYGLRVLSGLEMRQIAAGVPFPLRAGRPRSRDVSHHPLSDLRHQIGESGQGYELAGLGVWPPRRLSLAGDGLYFFGRREAIRRVPIRPALPSVRICS